MILFEGNDRFAYRDPACFYKDGTYYLFFTACEKENGFMCSQVAMSQSQDLAHWSNPRMITPRNINLNFCSPGNVVEHNGEYVLCFCSYPMPFLYAQQYYADETARLFTMRTKDFQTFSEPELLRAKGDVPREDMGRMIDPFILPFKDEFYLFFKQNGVSLSRSKDLVHWQYMGHAQAGENACVIPYQGQYLLIHSPENGIAFSVSHDLQNWTELSLTTLNQANWPWAAGRITAGFVMEAPSETGYRYLLFFHGSRDVFPETHGNASVALAFTNDLITFDY